MATLSEPKTRTQRKAAHGTCRLTLTINGTRYSVRPILADSSVALKAFRLRKDAGTVYNVTKTAYGNQCECGDFLFRREGLDPQGCKHVKALVACGLLAKDGES